VNEIMVRMATTVSTWDIVLADSAATTGTFNVDEGLIGAQTIGSVSF